MELKEKLDNIVDGYYTDSDDYKDIEQALIYYKIYKTKTPQLLDAIDKMWTDDSTHDKVQELADVLRSTLRDATR